MVRGQSCVVRWLIWFCGTGRLKKGEVETVELEAPVWKPCTYLDVVQCLLGLELQLSMKYGADMKTIKVEYSIGLCNYCIWIISRVTPRFLSWAAWDNSGSTYNVQITIFLFCVFSFSILLASNNKTVEYYFISMCSKSVVDKIYYLQRDSFMRTSYVNENVKEHYRWRTHLKVKLIISDIHWLADSSCDILNNSDGNFELFWTLHVSDVISFEQINIICWL